jgi:hypothetical protein
MQMYYPPKFAMPISNPMPYMPNMPTIPPNFQMMNMNPMMVPNMPPQTGQFNQQPMPWQSKPITQSKNN